MKRNAITIRPARSTDYAAVTALLSEAKLPLVGVEEHFTDFFVAEDSSIVGCAGLERYGNVALLRSVVVSPSARGNGLGQRLTQSCIDAARTSGIATLVLLTETAEAFFPRLGFKAVSRDEVPMAVRDSAEFRGVCAVSAQAMMLELTTE